MVLKKLAGCCRGCMLQGSLQLALQQRSQNVDTRTSAWHAHPQRLKGMQLLRNKSSNKMNAPLITNNKTYTKTMHCKTAFDSPRFSQLCLHFFQLLQLLEFFADQQRYLTKAIRPRRARKAEGAKDVLLAPKSLSFWYKPLKLNQPSPTSVIAKQWSLD